MDSPFVATKKHACYLSMVFQCEEAFRSQQLPINPHDYFPATLQQLKVAMSSPLFCKSDMVYCAKEIQKLFPDLENTRIEEFQTLNNRIKVWNNTRASPEKKLAQAENLPAYVGKKARLIEDLLIILDFEKYLYLLIHQSREEGKADALLDLKNKIPKLLPATLKSIGILKDLFPYLEFLLPKESLKGERLPIFPDFDEIQFEFSIFSDAFNEIAEDQIQFNDYLTKLGLARFRTFEELMGTLNQNNQDKLKEILNYASLEEFFSRISFILRNYSLSANQWNTLINRIEELYPRKRYTTDENAVFTILNNDYNPVFLALKNISYSCCETNLGQRISPLTTLDKLHQLVCDLKQEASLMDAVKSYLSNSEEILKLFSSKQKNSMVAHKDKQFIYTVYSLPDAAFNEFIDLTSCPYVLGTGKKINGHYVNFIRLKVFEKKHFIANTISKNLKSCIKKSSSHELKEALKSMQDHVKLIDLVKRNRLEPDLQSYLQSIKKSTRDRSLTPFLNDTEQLTQFFPSLPVTPEYFNNPMIPPFIEANQAVLEKIHAGWNQNKHHQKLLLDHAQKQIIALKKANQSSTIKKVNPGPIKESVTNSPPVKKDKKVTLIKIPKILETPIAIAKALIQGPPKLPPFPISSSTFPQVNAGPIARGMRSFTQPPPGKPFRYNKTQRVLDWENHPFGRELPTKVFNEKYTSLPLDIQKKVHIFHFPHPFVDLFLHRGIEGFWDSNRRVDIIAEIQYNNTTFKGVIGYTFDGNDCYHRCFTERLDDELAELRASHLKQQEFPLLEVATAPIPGRVAYADLKSQVFYDRSGNVIIKDSRRDVTIKLFKI